MENIEISLGNWRFNCGLVGFINILEYSGIKIKKTNNSIIFSKEELKKMLSGFEEKYFKFLIDRYEKTLSWYKIVSRKKFLEYIKKNIDTIDKEEIRIMDDYVGNVLKYYIKSNSYKAAYQCFEGKINPLELEKEIKKINLKKKEKVEDRKEDILNLIEKCLKMIEFCEEDESKKYLAAKNVIYTIIKNSWDGISFLSPQTKEKDVYKDLKEYFITPVVEYLEEDKSKYKYECFGCGNRIKNLKNEISFLNQTGFDTARKPSHVWDFENDLAICPICKLIYLCMPAGMIFVYDEGIFINANQSINEIVRINNLIYKEIYETENEKYSLTYKALAGALNNEKLEKLNYELVDVQVVRYIGESYRFNILSKKIIEIIRKSKNDLLFIGKGYYKEIKTNFRLYDEVMKKVLNNENLYVLIYRLLYYKITKTKDCHFTAEHLLRILNINSRILRGYGLMEEMNKNAKNAGYFLKKAYKEKKADEKIPGLCYKILNGLKLKNRNTVMNIIMNMYLYTSKAIPKIVVNMLDDENSLEQYGYAFVAGLLSYDQENEGGEKNEK